MDISVSLINFARITVNFYKVCMDSSANFNSTSAGGLEFEVSIVLQSNSRECVWMRAENAIRDLFIVPTWDIFTVMT